MAQGPERYPAPLKACLGTSHRAALSVLGSLSTVDPDLLRPMIFSSSFLTNPPEAGSTLLHSLGLSFCFPLVTQRILPSSFLLPQIMLSAPKTHRLTLYGFPPAFYRNLNSQNILWVHLFHLPSVSLGKAEGRRAAGKCVCR